MKVLEVTETREHAPSSTADWNRSPQRGTSLVNDDPVQRGLALLPASAAVYGVWHYPIVGTALAAGLLVFGALCVRFPGFWLFGIPFLLPLLDLAPWSGRLYLQELDLFLLVTLAVCLWQGQYRVSQRRRFPGGVRLALTAFTASYVWSLYAGLSPFPAPGANAFSSYYSNYNALRIARGFLWAVILLRPLSLLHRRDPAMARVYLLGGIVTGLLGTTFVALWERGVFHDVLYGADRYARLQGLLDFTTPYRITGMFSGMHTGGESIDGYLALAWPCALIAILVIPRQRWIMLLGAVTLPLALYAIVSTFSRASYLALAVSIAIFALGFMATIIRRAGALSASVSVVTSGALFALGALAFNQGGVIALGAVLFGFGACAIACFWRPALKPISLFIVAGGAIALTATLSYRAQITSKWVSVEPSTALQWAPALAVVSVLLGLPAGRYARRALSVKEFGVAAIMTAVVVSTLIPATFGYRMESRFATVRSDLTGRVAHWIDALTLLPSGWKTKISGIGLGAFPRLYLMAYPKKIDGVSVLAEDGGNTRLQIMGGKDVKVSQRVALPAFAAYAFRMDYRLLDEEANLRVQVCRRHMIHPSEYNHACRSLERNLKSTRGTWQKFEFPFELGDLGLDSQNLGRPPLVLEIANRREYRLMFKPPATIQIDNVELIDARGFNHVANGTFENGMDRWFPLYDFNHLPWHIKNLYVHLYFEQGALGVMSFLALLVLALRRGLASALQGDIFAFGIVVSLLGFSTVGLVGTLFDEPRIMLLFFLLMFSLIANHRTSAPPT